MKRPTGLTVLLLLAACSPRPELPPANSGITINRAPADDPVKQPPAAMTPAPLALAVEGEGLRLFNPANGAARPLPFGTARTLVLTALSERGAPERGTQSECGAGPLDYAAWPDGLKLYFQQDKFTGWALDGRAAGKVSTASGIGPGSSRTELEAAYAIDVVQSTLGPEFTAGDLSGLFDGPGPSASVAALWAGTSCNFR